jgi:hypothetical protein
MHFDDEQIAPPGQHPYDPPKSGVDPVAYALERLQTYLIWCESHRASYENARNDHPRSADNEMSCLRDAIEHAVVHLQRLTELVLAGHGVDSEKIPPKGLCGVVWRRTVESIARQRPGNNDSRRL